MPPTVQPQKHTLRLLLSFKVRFFFNIAHSCPPVVFVPVLCDDLDETCEEPYCFWPVVQVEKAAGERVRKSETGLRRHGSDKRQ